MDGGIRCERTGWAGVLTLARPDAGNVLDRPAVRALDAALAAWAADEGVQQVVVRGEGPAFSAGADWPALRESATASADGYLEELYRLAALVAAYPKPVVALMDGPVSGAAAIFPFHASHRVGTERFVFSLPETGLGLFPDAGSAALLGRLKGGFGMALALTGSSVGWGDALWCGLLTHGVRSADGDALVEALGRERADAALRQLADTPPRETDDALIHEIGLHFSRDGALDVVRSLQQAVGPRDPFAGRTLQSIERRAPLALAVAFRQLAAGAMLDVSDALAVDLPVARRMLAGRDFAEALRAGGEGRPPRWSPARLEEVDAAALERVLAPAAVAGTGAGEHPD